MSRLDALLTYAPSWLVGPIAADVFGAIGAQLDAIWDPSDEFFILTTSALIENWEKDYGIPVRPADDLAVRRLRVLMRKRGQSLRTDLDFLGFVQQSILPVATAAPTTYKVPARYVVYKPHDLGWVTNFDDVQGALADLGPAHVRLALAPWNTADGLLPSQLDRMYPVALDVLTAEEMDGRAARLAHHLIGRYTLDEVSGVRAESSGGPSLTDNNTVTQAAGKNDHAASFDSATTEYLSAADNALFRMSGVGAVKTFTFWVYFDAIGAQQELASQWTQTGNQRSYRIEALSTNVLRIQGSSDGANNTGSVSAPEVTVTTGQWYFVVAGVNGLQTFISVNGNPIHTAVPNGPLLASTADFRLGAYMTTVIASTLKGRLDEVNIFDIALDADDVAFLWNGGAGRFDPFV